MTGTRFAANSTADSMSLKCSSKSTVGDSPVVPTMTMPPVPSATCQSMSDFSRGRSSAPSAVIGVTMATRLPESMRAGCGKSAILPHANGLLAPRAQPLHGRRPRFVHDDVLVAQHAELSGHGGQQLAGGEQVFRVRGLAEALVAPGERLVDEDAARLEGLDQPRHQRP